MTHGAPAVRAWPVLGARCTFLAGATASALHLAAGGWVEIGEDDRLPAGRLELIAAGPLVTALLALVSGLALVALGWPPGGVPFVRSAAEVSLGSVLSAAFLINAVALVVNLVPVRPLDGGQLLVAARLRRRRSGG